MRASGAVTSRSGQPAGPSRRPIAVAAGGRSRTSLGLDGHPGIQGAQLRHGEGGDLAVGLDLPGKRAIAPGEPELDARPADAPGIEAATRSAGGAPG